MSLFHQLYPLLDTYWGMYVVQSVFHAMIASAIVGAVIFAWDIKQPLIRQRLRLIGILLTVVSFPVYQLFNPNRGDVFFRLNSLFDTRRLLFFEVFGVPMVTLFVFVIFVTLLLFIFQEMIPMLMSFVEKFRGELDIEDEKHKLSEVSLTKLQRALDELDVMEEMVIVFDEDELEIFSSTGLNPKIYLSTGLIARFDVRHLKAAIAHEIGHISRTRVPMLVFAYLLRLVMFFNPFIMIAFRKMVNEEEKICDDIAIAITEDPEALQEAVSMIREQVYRDGSDPESLTTALQTYSHDRVLLHRIRRVSDQAKGDGSWPLAMLTAVVSIVIINYHVV